MRVVPGFDKVGDGHSCPGLDREPASVEAFAAFPGGEATPTRGTIQAIPDQSRGPHRPDRTLPASQKSVPGPFGMAPGLPVRSPGSPGVDLHPLHKGRIGHQPVVTHSLITITSQSAWETQRWIGCQCAPTLRTAPPGSFHGGHRFDGHALAKPRRKRQMCLFLKGLQRPRKGVSADATPMENEG